MRELAGYYHSLAKTLGYSIAIALLLLAFESRSAVATDMDAAHTKVFQNTLLHHNNDRSSNHWQELKSSENTPRRKGQNSLLVANNTNSKELQEQPVEEYELLGASAAAIKGDIEYGEYLAGECLACHKTDMESEGIPSIIGWPKDLFIDALYSYKLNLRENPTMRAISKSLGDEEMASLAIYFGQIETE